MKPCPECGVEDRRVISSGLGGRWKAVCAACHYRYDGDAGEDVGEPVEPAVTRED